MFLGKNDDGVAIRLLNGIPYEPESIKLWRSLCKGVVVDVGAHTGIYTLNAFDVGATCLSIEPFFLNFARLVLNLKANGYPKNGLFFGAASSANGIVDFSANNDVGYCGTGGRIGRGLRTYPVNAFKLDTLLAEKTHPEITVVKIDVENHCKEVLKGMPEILAHRPQLLFECTEGGLGEILEPLGYKFFLIDEETGLEPVKELKPEVRDGKPIMTRLNRYAHV